MSKEHTKLLEAVRKYGNTTALAQELGVSRQSIYAWCDGLRKPNIQHTRDLEALLGISREEIRPDIYAI